MTTMAPARTETPLPYGPSTVGRQPGEDLRFASGVTGALPLNILQINGGLLIRPCQPDQAPLNAEHLTGREREVLALVAEGYSNKLIGGELAIAERTVKSHLTDIMAKLRASDRTHAVVTAVRLGWLVI